MIILHSDLNNFYASVECVTNPKLKNEYVAVCGSVEDRHGIVLAKNQKAKLCGVATGEPIWKAKLKCPSLVTVAPHFDKYKYYSNAVREIYKNYTDYIEPFGSDECWLDVTGSTRLFGNGKSIADSIRERVKSETGLTVSVGVSFNKIFAKLGSDMKKPDAVTIIGEDDFREKIWGLDVGSLMGVGASSAKKLKQYKIETIGDLANTPMEFLKKILGKNGVWMWKYANGLDSSPVQHMDYKSIPKSIGHGVTCRENLINCNEVWRVMYRLCLSVSDSLREEKLLAGSVAIEIKNQNLETKQLCAPLSPPTHSAYDLAKKAYEIFAERYALGTEVCVRSVSVRAVNLTDENHSRQLSFFDDTAKSEKLEKSELTFSNLRQKYGGIITYGSLMGDLKFPRNAPPKAELPHFR